MLPIPTMALPTRRLNHSAETSRYGMVAPPRVTTLHGHNEGRRELMPIKVYHASMSPVPDSNDAARSFSEQIEDLDESNLRLIAHLSTEDGGGVRLEPAS